jgi:tRNA A37 threonylcarbamoyladenosine modification protein TsaB
MIEKSKFRIYIDSTDRNSTKLTLLKIKKDKEIKISGKEGQVDIVFGIQKMLDSAHLSLKDIEKVDYNPGPGSFTGLRMGATVSNVLNWVLGKKKVKDLEYPSYGAEPKITPPKKFNL